MHDLHENEKVLSFLSDFIDDIKQMGYEIVTVSELLNLKQGRCFHSGGLKSPELTGRVVDAV
jgi:hypothetical protein